MFVCLSVCLSVCLFVRFGMSKSKRISSQIICDDMAIYLRFSANFFLFKISSQIICGEISKIFYPQFLHFQNFLPPIFSQKILPPFFFAKNFTPFFFAKCCLGGRADGTISVRGSHQCELVKSKIWSITSDLGSDLWKRRRSPSKAL